MHLNVALAVLAMITIKFASAAPAPWDRAKSAPSNNAYSGAAGQASGGSVYTASTESAGLLGFLLPGGSGPLLNAFSNNAGNAGEANSGDALGLRHEHEHEPALSDMPSNANSFSGAAGQAAGGSVRTAPGLVNIVSNNAGNGGQASTGSSVSGGRLNTKEHRLQQRMETNGL